MNVQDLSQSIKPYYAQEHFRYFDIETIPCQDESYLLELERKVKPPANLKKQESIDKWLSENRKSAALDAMAKTSFDGSRGHVCTISWAMNDRKIEVAHAKTVEEEKGVIQEFFGSYNKYHSEVLVGHNITGFDIDFLKKRAIILGVPLPSNAKLPRDVKPWSKGVHDTMVMWAGAKGRISMDALCSIFGIKGKEGFDGSMVASAWANGEHDKIAEYCKDDVYRTRKIHQKFLEANW